MHSKLAPMKEVAALMRRRLGGIVAWDHARQASGFLEAALDSLFQAAKRHARGFSNFDTIKTVIFLVACVLDFTAVNLHAREPTRLSTGFHQPYKGGSGTPVIFSSESLDCWYFSPKFIWASIAALNFSSISSGFPPSLACSSASVVL